MYGNDYTPPGCNVKEECSKTYSLSGLTESSTASSSVISAVQTSPEIQANLAGAKTSQAAAAAQMYSGHEATAAEMAASSKVLILSTPKGAEILVDGNLAGVTPLAFGLLSHGPDKPRVITVRLKGYVTVEKSVIPDGKDVPIGLTLVPDPVK
jgi:hypothetical protein